jgi:hypothetical protein
MALPGRYSPIYSGVWSDDSLEGTSFEEKAFFIFLWSNDRVRPSGIYRVTDEQLAADTGLGRRRIRGYLHDLVKRGRIVRDGAWIFVRGYLNRQPNHARLLIGARQDVAGCNSGVILEAFCQRYPLYHKWSADRHQTISKPMHEFRAQNRSDQNRSEQAESDGLPTVTDSDELSLSRTGRSGGTRTGPKRPGRGTEEGQGDPESVAAILKRAPGFRP